MQSFLDSQLAAAGHSIESAAAETRAVAAKKKGDDEKLSEQKEKLQKQRQMMLDQKKKMQQQKSSSAQKTGALKGSLPQDKLHTLFQLEDDDQGDEVSAATKRGFERVGAPPPVSLAPVESALDLATENEIIQLATFVQQRGRAFEQIIKTANANSGKFSWLFHEAGREYQRYLALLPPHLKEQSVPSLSAVPSGVPVVPVAAAASTTPTAPDSAAGKKRRRWDDGKTDAAVTESAGGDVRVSRWGSEAAGVTPTPAIVASKSRDDDDDDGESSSDSFAGLDDDQKSLAKMENYMKRLQKQEGTDGMGGRKHHISHFLPDDEFAKFTAKAKGAPIPDDTRNKLTEDNKGYGLLKKLGWSEGTGLGRDRTGIVNPIAAGAALPGAGLGTKEAIEVSSSDDSFLQYKKRMALSYRFRPNPLNNQRTPYWQDPSMNEGATQRL